jgi:peroxiredoxin
VVRKKYILFISIVALFCSLCNFGASYALDELAPDFQALDLNGKIFSSQDFKGKPVILFFWTTWCPYCRRELNTLEEIYPQLKKEGIVVLAINTGESNYRVSSFLKNRKVSFTVVLDKDNSVAESFSIWGIPTYVLIDSDARIRFKHNYFPRETYKNLILKK